MREIKFRAWDGNKMHNVSALYFSEISSGKKACRVYDNIVDQLIFADVIMQFTGLKDKNGKEIYAGDLLLIKIKCDSYNLEAIYEVVDRGFTTEFRIVNLISPEAVFSNITLEAGEDFEWYAGERLEIRANQYRESSTNIEVIGNIYQNPELL